MARQNRSTKQKEVIAKALSGIDSFFSAEALLKKVEKDGIGMATVYRYLKSAVETGELFTYQCDRRAIYSKGKKSHCHFICENTGKMIHFDVDNIDFLKDKIPGSITSFQLEVKGVCAECNQDAKSSSLILNKSVCAKHS